MRNPKVVITTSGVELISIQKTCLEKIGPLLVAGVLDQSPFFSNQRKRSRQAIRRMTITTQWLMPRTWGRVILPKSPHVSTVPLRAG